MGFGGRNGMSSSSSIVPHLPYLRRFSRALTGNQQGGDAYVAAMLEVVVADAHNLPAEPHRLRLALYRNLCKLWNALPTNAGREVPTATWEASLQRKLAQLPSRTRQVFL